MQTSLTDCLHALFRLSGMNLGSAGSITMSVLTAYQNEEKVRGGTWVGAAESLFTAVQLMENPAGEETAKQFGFYVSRGEGISAGYELKEMLKDGMRFYQEDENQKIDMTERVEEALNRSVTEMMASPSEEMGAYFINMLASEPGYERLTDAHQLGRTHHKYLDSLRADNEKYQFTSKDHWLGRLHAWKECFQANPIPAQDKLDYASALKSVFIFNEYLAVQAMQDADSAEMESIGGVRMPQR